MQDQAASANVGRAGEYLALSRLSLAGNFCTLAQFQDHDAYIQTDTHKILTLQVKSASKKRFHRYQFYTQQGKARKRSDIYAFVAIDIEKIFWCRGDNKIIAPAGIKLRFEMFDEPTMQEVLASFVAP